MRLTVSLVTAAALHGVLFGVAAAVLSRPTTAAPAPEAVDVELTAPPPDPVVDSAATAREIPAKTTPPPKARTIPHRPEIAVVSDPEPNAPTTVSVAPAPSALASKAGPAVSPNAARTSDVPSGKAMVSATPRYRTNPMPDYPLPCKRRREEGIVFLNVVVQADGLPAAISLNRSSGHPLLDRSALDAVRSWTFEPGRAAGVPVSSRVVVPVRFSLEQL